MKLVYLAVFDRKRDIGVCNKIADQLKGFEAYGIKTKLVRVSQVVSHISIMGKEFLSVSYLWKDIRFQDDIDTVYIRYPKCSPGFLCFLRKIKKGRPDRKVIIEIPTYPYEGELHLEDFLPAMVDKVSRCLLKKYVDRIVTYSDDRYIFGIKTIQSVNGIYIKDVPPREIKGAADEINMIAVASMKPWHGYERVIEGIYRYYKNGGNRKLKLYFVGLGPELAKYKNLAKKYNIKDKCVFCGAKTGEELKELYDVCDVGIVDFGSHRKGLTLLSSIKTREYAAKGLPMVTSGKIDIFPPNKYKFILEQAGDETPIDIEKLIGWYDTLYGPNGVNRKEVAEMIRGIAYEKCDIKVAMKHLCNYIVQGRKA